MSKEIVLTGRAVRDLAELPGKVEDTFLSKKDSTQKNLGIGAEPVQAFDKYLSGNMHPVLQMNLGRDYRAWFIEGEYIDSLDDNKIYCIKIMKKPEAKKLTGKNQERFRTRSRIVSVSEMTSPSSACFKDSSSSSSSCSESFTSSPVSTVLDINYNWKRELISFMVSEAKTSNRSIHETTVSIIKQPAKGIHETKSMIEVMA